MMWIIAFVWLGGAAYILGTDRGIAKDWTDVLAIILWPLTLVYIVTWGVRNNRKWYCWLTSHKYKRIKYGFENEGGSPLYADKCQRCHKTTNVTPSEGDEA